MKYNSVYITVIFFIGLLFPSCNDSSGETSPHAFIAGEIVNPTSEYLVLFKNLEPIDTAYLNLENQFRFKIENVDKGLYLIKHNLETQNIHISPNDSILFRVNTLRFDESLHFSGRGAEKNNFLINTFLLDEDNTQLILSYYKIPPKEFAQKTDSIRQERLNTLKNLNKKFNFSKDFLEIATKNIAYEFYDLRERYTYFLNKYYKKFAAKIPEDFHDYRNAVSFNEEALQSSLGYKRFIGNYLINQSIEGCIEQHGDIKSCYQLKSVQNIKNRIELIDSLTNLEDLKMHFFSQLGALAMTMGKSREELISVLDLLEEKGLGEEKLYELRILGSIQLTFIPGRIIDDVPLLNTSGKTIDIQEIISKPSIIFLWSVDRPASHKKEHELIQEYRKKYPEIDFIGINLDIGETSKWINSITKNGYNADMEFQLEEIEIGEKTLDQDFLKYYLNKLLFLDASGKVIIGDASLYSPEFESIILELLNQ